MLSLEGNCMPNDARLGLLVGMVVVIALAVLYRGGGSRSVPEAQVPGPSPAVDGASLLKSGPPPVLPSLPAGEQSGGSQVGGKKNPTDRVDGQPDSADQPEDEQ
jgi:hypothetical protein